MSRKFFFFISNLVLAVSICAMEKVGDLKDRWCDELLPLTMALDKITSHRQTVDISTDDEKSDYKQVNTTSTTTEQQLHCQQALLFALLLQQGITDLKRLNDEQPDVHFLVFIPSYENHIRAITNPTSSYNPLLPDKITKTNIGFAALLKVKLFDASSLEEIDLNRLKKRFIASLPSSKEKPPANSTQGAYYEFCIDRWIDAYTRASRCKYCYEIQERNCNIARQALQFLNFHDEFSQRFYDRAFKTAQDIQNFFTKQQQMIRERSLKDQSDFSLYWCGQENSLEKLFQRSCSRFNALDTKTILKHITDFRAASAGIYNTYGTLTHPILEKNTIAQALRCAQQAATFADKLEEKLLMRFSKNGTAAAPQNRATDERWPQG